MRIGILGCGLAGITLGALIKAPSYYSIGDHADELATRRNYVLDRMQKVEGELAGIERTMPSFKESINSIEKTIKPLKEKVTKNLAEMVIYVSK